MTSAIVLLIKSLTPLAVAIGSIRSLTQPAVPVWVVAASIVVLARRGNRVARGGNLFAGFWETQPTRQAREGSALHCGRYALRGRESKLPRKRASAER